MSGPTVNRLVCLGIKHSSGLTTRFLLLLRQLRVCWCGALSVTRGRVCRLQLLLALASAVILRSESRGTRDHILLSQIRDFPFRRLLRLAGLRLRYSIPPSHELTSYWSERPLIERINIHGNACWSHSDVLVSRNQYPWKYLSFSYSRKHVT
jgi:hypothetical protein